MGAHNSHGIPRNSIITVAGMVGVGKSTMTKALANTLNFKTSFEKVEQNPYLEKFYQDFAKWSFHLQIYFLAERFKAQQKIFATGGGVIQDRSIYEDTSIFAKMHVDQGTMSKTDYETYTNLFEAMVMTPYFPHPDLLIYLDGPFEAILKRIEARGRQAERDTPISYWEDVYRRYQDWIDTFDACPVLRLNITDYDVLQSPDSMQHILAKIGEAIQNNKE